MPFRNVSWQPLALGLNEDENPDALQPGDLIQALNLQWRGRTVGTRPGLERADDYASAINGDAAVVGIYDYRRNNDANRDLVAASGGNLVTGPAGGDVLDKVTNSVAITAGDTNYWVFATHSGNLYAAGGGTQDDFAKWTGSGALTSVTINNLSAAALSPSYVFEKWNYLWAAGFTLQSNGALATDASSNPMVARFSSLNQPDDWPAGNSIGGSSAIGGLSSYGGEYITGFGDFTDNSGDWLLILTNRRIYQVLQDPDPLKLFFVSPGRGAIANGCVHQRAFVSLGLDSSEAVYLSRNGIHSLRQSQQFGPQEDKFLSWKIRNTFKQINFARIGQATGAYDRRNGRVIFAVPYLTSTVNNLLLVLDIKDTDELTAQSAKWSVWFLAGSTADARAANTLYAGIGDDSIDYIYCGNNEGDLTRFSDDTVFSDLGSSYTATLQTHHENFNQIGVEKILGDVHLLIQPGGSYKPVLVPIFDYGTDFGLPQDIAMPPNAQALWDSAVWDAAVWGGDEQEVFRIKLCPFGRFEALSFQVTHTGVNEPFFLAGLGFQTDVEGESAGE